MSTETTRVVDELARRVPGATRGEDEVLHLDAASAVETLRRVDSALAGGVAGSADYAGDPAGTAGDARPERRIVAGGNPDARAAIPYAELFDEDETVPLDFIPAPEIMRIADALIAALEELGFLRAVTIYYRWRRKAQTKAGKVDHPTQKPFGVITPLIEASCPPGGLILDPFMGSGTILVAAQQEGRRAIGIEIEEKYCEIAVKRLRQAVLPLVWCGDGAARGRGPTG